MRTRNWNFASRPCSATASCSWTRATCVRVYVVELIDVSIEARVHVHQRQSEKVKSLEKLLAKREWKHQFREMNNEHAAVIHWSDENEKQEPIAGVQLHSTMCISIYVHSTMFIAQAYRAHTRTDGRIVIFTKEISLHSIFMSPVLAEPGLYPWMNGLALCSEIDQVFLLFPFRQPQTIPEHTHWRFMCNPVVVMRVIKMMKCKTK